MKQKDTDRTDITMKDTDNTSVFFAFARRRLRNLCNPSKICLICVLSLLLELGSPFFLAPKRIVRANELIEADEYGRAMFVNENPNFKVEFGDQDNPTKHHVRFEAVPSGENPFAEGESTQIEQITTDNTDKGFVESVKNLFGLRSSKRSGIEFSLVEASIAENTQIEQINTDNTDETDLLDLSPSVESVSLSPTQQRILDNLNEEIEKIAQESATISARLEEIKEDTKEIVTEAREIYAQTELISSSQNNAETNAEERGKDVITNREVIPGVDVEYEILAGKGVKEEIIIKQQEGFGAECVQNLTQKDAEFSGCQLPKNTYTFQLTLDPGVQLHRTFTGTKDRPAGLWYFTDEQGRYLGHFLPPFAVDSAENKTNNVKLDIQRDSASSSASFRAILTVDLEWLLSPDRTYPIRIDPTVVHDTATEFTAGTMNRIENVGVGETAPELVTFQRELPADEHTVGLWHMNDNVSGTGQTITDDSGNGNDGTTAGSASIDCTVSGKLGYGCDFDGTDDYVNAGNPDSLNITGAMTILVWVKTSYSAAFQTVIAKEAYVNGSDNAGYMIGILTTGKLEISFRNNEVNNLTSNTVMNDGKWHQIGVTFVSGTQKAYLDGIEDGSQSTVSSIKTTTNPLNIGRQYRSATNYFNGLIDEVTIYNRALTPEEIKASASRRSYGVYTSSVIDLTADVQSIDSLAWSEAGVQTGDGETLYSSTDLEAHWKFNETSGTSAADSSANSNTGTVTNMTTSGQDAAAGDGWTADNKRWGAGALMFDGSDGYVDISHDSSLNFGTGSFSASSWVKSSAAEGGIFGKYKVTGGEIGWSLEFNSGVLWSYFYDGTASESETGTADVDNGAWHYVVLVRDTANSKVYVYVDGVADIDATDATAGNNLDSSTSFKIGDKVEKTYNEYFNGTIDSTRIYSRALGADEVLANYQAGQIEFQTRTGADNSPDDGSWEAWKPTTSESQILSMDSDKDNWKTSYNWPYNWFNSNWNYRKKFTIESGQISGSPTDIPVALVISSDSDLAADARSDAYDIVITKGDGTTELDYERVAWNSGTGALEIWFKVPDPQSGDDYYLYYGNADQATDRQNATGVWDANYKGVWHLQEASEHFLDSTSNNHDSTTETVDTRGVACKVGLCPNNDSGKIEIPDHADWAFGSSDFTIAYWINFDVASDTRHIRQGVSSDDDWYIMVDLYASRDRLEWEERVGGVQEGMAYSPNDSFVIATGTWYYVVLTRTGATWVFSKDGSALATTVAHTSDVDDFAADLQFLLIDGLQDEVRISHTVRSDDWITTSYNNQKSAAPGGTFWSALGSEEGLPDSFSDDTTTYYEGSGSMKVQLGAPQVDANTVALWHFEETNGDLAGVDVFDETDNDNDGEFAGSGIATGVVDGIFGKARDFNGSDDYVDAGTSQSLCPDDDITIEFWVNFDEWATDDHIIERGAGESVTEYYLRENSGNLQFLYAPPPGNDLYFDCEYAFSNLNTGQWYHFALIGVEGSKCGMYIDGVLVESDTGSAAGPASKTSTALTIGGSDGSGKFNGKLDEVRISNVARTADEIAEGYRAGRDHRLSRTISSTDLSDDTKLPFYIAADRPGTYLSASISESAYSAYISDSSTIGLWHLEEDSGYCDSGESGCVKDSSSSGNDSTPGGDPTTVQGKIGKGWDFDGDDYVVIDNSENLNLPGSFTLEAWVKTDVETPTADHMAMVAKGDTDKYEYRLTLHSDGYANISIFQLSGAGYGDAAGSTDLTDNNWHHIVGVFTSATKLEIFVDGALVGTDITFVGSRDSSDILVNIGRGADPEWYFTGTIDEVRISDVARTADQIRQAYEIGRRTHPITIDFGADLDGIDIAGTSEANAKTDTTFTIDATAYGFEDKGDNLYKGDKVIIRENYGGTEYIATGTVTAVNASTGVVTVASLTGTVPAAGTGVCGGSNTHCFTANARVFKWQREWFDLTGPLDSHINATTRITLRVTDGSEGRTFWLDDFKSGGAYITSSPYSSFDEANQTSTQRYFQYRFIVSTTDTVVTPYITSATVTYTTGPTNDLLMRHGKWFSSGAKQSFWWAQ